MQFTIVVCGLDSIEARRWINSTLVDMAQGGDPVKLEAVDRWRH